jgi:transketolase
LAKENLDVVYVGSDVGIGTLKEFQEEMPDRYFIEGIAEAYVIGMAAGLAMSGKMPYVNTIATFLTRRCYDQIAIDVCMGNHNVRLYANGGGLVYAPLGPTHLATDDIALMRALPNMTVIVPADADEMERAVLASGQHQGPIYFRVARGGDPLVSQSGHRFQIGKAIVLQEPKELLLIASGIMVHRAIEVADQLKLEGIQAGVINMHTIKPLDIETLSSYLFTTPNVITLEEHSIIGGLGSAVAQLIAEGTRHPQGLFRMMGIPDCFPDKYGRQGDLMKYFGLEVKDILEVSRKMLLDQNALIV